MYITLKLFKDKLAVEGVSADANGNLVITERCADEHDFVGSTVAGLTPYKLSR